MVTLIRFLSICIRLTLFIIPHSGPGRLGGGGTIRWKEQNIVNVSRARLTPQRVLWPAAVLLCWMELVSSCWKSKNFFVFSGCLSKLRGFCLLTQSTKSQLYTHLNKKKIMSFESACNRTYLRSAGRAHALGTKECRRHMHSVSHAYVLCSPHHRVSYTDLSVLYLLWHPMATVQDAFSGL